MGEGSRGRERERESVCVCVCARVGGWDFKEAGREANQTAQQADAQGEAGAT